MDGERADGHDLTMGRRVLVVDDHEGFRRVATRVLESSGFTVVGEAVSGEAAVTAAVRLVPAVVLLDVHLPDVDGFEVARRLAVAVPGAQVILTSSRDASDYQSRLPAAGALGFIGKADLSGPRIVALVGAA